MKKFSKKELLIVANALNVLKGSMSTGSKKRPLFLSLLNQQGITEEEVNNLTESVISQLKTKSINQTSN